MKPNYPTISAIIGVYNGANFIEEALKSILAQSYPPLEIIVVDDGSRDNTASIVEGLARLHPHIHLIKQANQGVGAARNTGIRQAQGDYIALLDHDDRWLPTYLARMIAQAEPDLLITSRYYRIDQQSRILGQGRFVHPAKTRFPFILTGNNIYMSGIMFSKQLWEKSGPLDETLSGAGGEDWDWYIQVLLRGGSFKHLQTFLWQYREHSTNNTRNVKAMTDNTWYVLDKTFQQPDLSPNLQKWQSYAYYLNAVLAAGKFYALGEHTTAKLYLEKAYGYSPGDFVTLQTFISFLKIYLQTALHPEPVENQQRATDFVAVACPDQTKRRLLTALGRLTLGLLSLRRPAYSLGQLFSAWKSYPTLFFQPGVYRVLFRYGYSYLRDKLYLFREGIKSYLLRP